MAWLWQVPLFFRWTSRVEKILREHQSLSCISKAGSQTSRLSPNYRSFTCFELVTKCKTGSMVVKQGPPELRHVKSRGTTGINLSAMIDGNWCSFVSRHFTPLLARKVSQRWILRSIYRVLAAPNHLQAPPYRPIALWQSLSHAGSGKAGLMLGQ